MLSSIFSFTIVLFHMFFILPVLLSKQQAAPVLLWAVFKQHFMALAIMMHVAEDLVPTCTQRHFSLGKLCFKFLWSPISVTKQTLSVNVSKSYRLVKPTHCGGGCSAATPEYGLNHCWLEILYIYQWGGKKQERHCDFIYKLYLSVKQNKKIQQYSPSPKQQQTKLQYFHMP